MIKSKSRLTLLVFVSVLLGIYFTINAVAQKPLNPSAPSEISIQYEHEGSPLPNAAFSIYQVATVSSSARFSMVGSFADYPVKINDLNSSGYAAAASTLATYVAADKIAPMETGKTDTQGRLFFKNLPTGLYLVLGEEKIHNNKKYSPVPVLLSLPEQDERAEWQYEVVLLPKFEIRPVGGEPDAVNRRVIKAWNDNDDLANERPSSVRIELLRDGELFDSVLLSSRNDWSHTWQNLDNSYNWLVIESNVPKNYNVLYTESGMMFKVSNSHVSVDEPPSTTEEPSDDSTEDTGHGGGSQTDPEYPGPSDSTDSHYTSDPYDPSGSPSKPVDPSKPPPKLPQTGQLWWPVPLSAGFGMVFFATGWFLVFRKKKNEDEK